MSEQIYDVYVLRTTGIPIFAGCTATDYCIMRMDQHELHSAFLAAMYNFSKESFSDTDIQTIVYGDIVLNFALSPSDNFMMIFFHQNIDEIDSESIRAKLRKAMDIFMNKYAPQIGEHESGDDLFEDFKTDLQNLQVLPSPKLMDLSKMMMMDEKKEKEGPRIFKLLKFWRK